MKTLIVDDDTTSTVILQGLLARYGDCRTAVNGLEGVKAAGEALNAGKPFDLICMDLQMPGMDGQTALEEIRSLETDEGIADLDRSKIVVITGSSDKEAVVNAVRARCDGYLIKPFQKSRLLEELHRLRLL